MFVKMYLALKISNLLGHNFYYAIFYKEWILMKIYEDVFHCKTCGDFDWKYCKLDNGQAIIGSLSEICKNVKNVSKENNSIILELKCPICGRCYKKNLNM